MSLNTALLKIGFDRFLHLCFCVVPLIISSDTVLAVFNESNNQLFFICTKSSDSQRVTHLLHVIEHPASVLWHPGVDAPFEAVLVPIAHYAVQTGWPVADQREEGASGVSVARVSISVPGLGTNLSPGLGHRLWTTPLTYFKHYHFSQLPRRVIQSEVGDPKTTHSQRVILVVFRAQPKCPWTLHRRVQL